MSVIRDEWRKAVIEGSDVTTKQAWELVNNLYSIQSGNPPERLGKVANYLNESLFMAKGNVKNIFDGSRIVDYKILYYAQNTVLPKLYTALVKKLEHQEDPLRLRNWN